MTGVENKRMPAWARVERRRDLARIDGNVENFRLLAIAAFEESGYGAIFVDTTTRPAPGPGQSRITVGWRRCKSQ